MVKSINRELVESFTHFCLRHFWVKMDAESTGLEWLFRLADDPRRLWKRYLKHNPRFVYYFLLQLIREKKEKKRSNNLFKKPDP